MALTATEQLSLMSGELAPPDTDLQSLILQIAAINAEEFYVGYKEFDGETNPLAENYLNKMLSTCDQVITGKGNILALTRSMVVLIGKAVTLNQITNATQEQWETFLDGKMIDAFELFSRVRKTEKTAYDAL